MLTIMKYEVVEGILKNLYVFYFFFLVGLWIMELEGYHSFKESMSWNANCGTFMVM